MRKRNLIIRIIPKLFIGYNLLALKVFRYGTVYCPSLDRTDGGFKFIYPIVNNGF